ncbi:MAG: nuclear transport factor 2 family protein, partial [Candidatus Heimdallarchaeota archaeon]|nr:nuclear transport factor 2 family protein [Candidatus Heimdallarchaeota archaeon]MCK5048476.1 nuclear transport factor 2 family protein [Candidatus Heimdallarchaeota archaeon]
LEWWTDYEHIVKTLKSQLEQMRGFKVIAGDIQAFEEGTVGWFADQATLRMPDGLEIPIRITGIFHKENSDWKIVQWHGSVGIANVDAIGEELDV